MSRSVVLNLGSGSLSTGFPHVVAEIHLPNQLRLTKSQASLPAAPDLLDLYRRWQILYGGYYEHLRGQVSEVDPDFEIDEVNVSRFSELDFRQVCEQLPDRLNHWLDSEAFRPIDRQLRTHLDRVEEIHITIETNDEQVRRLPWCLWRFLEDFLHSEVELSNLSYERAPAQPRSTTGVKILVILGDSAGMNFDPDHQIIKKIPGAVPTLLKEPKATELSDRLWSQGWDILCFAGHSSSQGEKGRIYLNPKESLTIEELRPALRTAIANGLKLAIFNSCDGLKLAGDLSDLHIPATIVMREPVPNQIAQEFLQYFLKAFADGESLHCAFRQSREQLHTYQKEFPCAAWLPTLIRNPAVEPPTWGDWLARSKQGRSNFWRSLQIVGCISVLLTSFAIGIRQTGVLQPAELWSYDHLTRMRPIPIQPDDRLYVIQVTQDDLQHYAGDPHGSLSDYTVAQLLKKLTKHRPQVIGLDIYRDIPVPNGQAALAIRIKQTPQLVAICKHLDKSDNSKEGYRPPSNIPEEQLGFSDFVIDSEKFLRRYRLGADPGNALCRTHISFSVQIALKFLREKYSIELDKSSDTLKLNGVEFSRLKFNSGAYRQAGIELDDGDQIMLNYRPYYRLSDIARGISLKKFLEEDDVDSDQVGGKIVLIGYTERRNEDQFTTPYSAVNLLNHETPGVFIHAQMISQILDVALRERPLIQGLPSSLEFLWSWNWALLTGFLMWYGRSWLIISLLSVVILVSLYFICLGMLTSGIWLPLIPTLIAIFLMAGILVGYNELRSFNHR